VYEDIGLLWQCLRDGFDEVLDLAAGSAQL
jgi:hypothetical protein